MCRHCGGRKTLYQEDRDTKLFINTTGKAQALYVECNPCPPHASCCMKDIPSRAAFIINYCPECGRPLAPSEPLTLEQLKEMEGKPVWTQFIDGSGGCWGLIATSELGLHAITGDCSSQWESWYGITWIAYERKPKEEMQDA